MPGVIELVTEAKASIDNLTAEQVAAELDGGDVLLVDIREPGETANGIIEGAVLAPRGMLEFHADPTTPYHLEPFNPDRRVILYCASSGRSALGVKALQELGYSDVVHLDGGIKAWQEDGRPITDA